MPCLAPTILSETKVDFTLSIDRTKLERVDMKYLGAILDTHLTFVHHVNYVQSKSVQEIGILRKSRNFLHRAASLLLYKSLVLSYLDYCDLIYECTNKSKL